MNVLRAMGTGVPIPRLQEWADLTEYDRDQVLAFDDWLQNYNGRFFFNDRLGDVDEICADARRLKVEYGLDLVFVDYLQLVSGFADERNRERVVNQIGKQLFALAKQLDVAVVAPVQVTKPGSDRLAIDDVRESKALTHDARLVVMLNRPWQAHKDRMMNLECDATLQIEKNRGGRTGDLRVHFDGAVQRFTEGKCPDGCRYARRAQRENH
jgi:replicative DNA helicase